MSRRERLLLVALLTLGVLLRAAYLVAPVMDADQAIFGLQARHVLRGEFPVFSWGYAYIGTPQSYLTAVAFALFGSSRLLLDAVPLLLSIPFVLACYALGRTSNGPALGLVAAALAAIAPPYLALHGAWARHGYMDTVLLGSVILLLAARLAGGARGEPWEARRFAVLGLVAGVAWWVNVSSLFYLVPAACFLLLADWRAVARRGPWLAVGFFLLGSAPFWLWNAAHRFTTFRLFKGRATGPASGQLARIVTEGLPAILGARGSYARTNFVPGASAALLALYAVALAWLLWRALATVRAGRRPDAPTVLLLLFFVTAGALLAGSRYAEAITAEGTKRYLLPLYPAVLLLGALFLDRIRQRSRRLFAGLLALPLGLAVHGNLVSYPLFTGELPGYRAGRAQDDALVAWLRARGLSRVYATDYWLAPRLTFDASEALVVARPAGDRYPPYQRLVDAAPRVAYLFADGEADAFAEALRGIGAAFERTAIGSYVVFHDFRPPASIEALRAVPADAWSATASALATPPGRAFDRDVDTSWYSGEPQRPGQFFELDLGRPTGVAKVVLLPPRPSVGVPRGYRIEVSSDGARWEETAAVAAARWSLDWAEGQPRMGRRYRVLTAFAPRAIRYVRVQQTGTDPRWWWAIGEIFVYGPASVDHPEPEVGRALLEAGRADERVGRLGAAARAYWEATRRQPELEPAHARLAAAYDEARVPLEGASSPVARAGAFEALGLPVKAAREYERELAATPDHRDHTDVWRRLARAYRQAGERARADELEERLRRDFTPAVPAAAAFGDDIRLLGFRLEADRVAPGQPFRVTYYWEARAAAADDYVVFVHLTRDGQVAFQHDHAPLAGTYPTSRWQAGEQVRETVEVGLPAGLQAGRYEIVLGLSAPRSGRRLPVGETSLPHRKDRVVIGAFELGS